MSKVADLTLVWIPSASEDVAKQSVEVSINGVAQARLVIDGPSTGEVNVDAVAANSTVDYKVVTEDTDGNVTSSITFSFKIGDLVAPLAATNLGFRIRNVRDVDDTPPA